MRAGIGRVPLAVVVLAAGFAGCSGGGGREPTLVPVSGTVTLDGKPLAGASVSFVPQAGTEGAGAFGTTDAEGRYTLDHRSGKPGIEPGTYTVSFSKMGLKDGSPIPPGKTAADVEAVEQVPRQYTPGFQSTNDTPATAALVEASGGTFDFALVSGPRR
jgi:hypothetical protein